MQVRQEGSQEDLGSHAVHGLEGAHEPLILGEARRKPPHTDVGRVSQDREETFVGEVGEPIAAIGAVCPRFGCSRGLGCVGRGVLCKVPGVCD